MPSRSNMAAPESKGLWDYQTENEIKVRVDQHFRTPEKTKSFFNAKMGICRELNLCALAALNEETGKEIYCLDAFGATGISGLQWLTKLQSAVSVVINDKDESSVENIKQNCALNNIKAIDFAVNDCEAVEKDGGMREENGTKQRSVAVANKDANVIMHERQFDFINLDPFGCTVHFLDAAFRNIRNNGLLIVTSTDVASLYGKCPHVARRNYGVYTMKTEYYKEAAARIVIGACQRSAAHCNKGFDVLYTVAVEHYVSVALKIKRGPSHADAGVQKVQKLLHCQFCHDRVFYPDSVTPVENPYSLLECDCKSSYPGKTAVELGPMWCGNLYKSTFLRKMSSKAESLHLSEQVNTLLQTLIAEAECKTFAEKNTKDEKCIQKMDSNSSYATVHTMLIDKVSNSLSEKRKLENMNEDDSAKRLEVGDSSVEAGTLPFYWNIHYRKLTGVDPPKTPKLVNIMHSEGYHASRTHFDTLSIRTNASLKQLINVLNKHCTKGK